MCDHCGCSEEHVHGLATHIHSPAKTVEINEPILAENNRFAQENRERFVTAGILAVNVLSAPGSGKTALIERTLQDCARSIPTAVIVGDLATENDANRIRSKGAPAVQITTGTACHLDARMVERAYSSLKPNGIRLLFIENVGNLVCPASFDLGEQLRVVLLSVTEGEDKPLKYPPIFHGAHVVLFNKIDLAGAAGFDRNAAIENVRSVSPHSPILEVSAKTGEGMEVWYAFLRRHLDHRAVHG